MTTPSLTVRPLNSTAEYTAYYRLANTAFSPEPSEEEAQRWYLDMLHDPDFQAERARGAFRAEQLLGGYTVHDRVLRMGAARISIGGIGGVVADPETRKQGVARALMLDSLAFARANHHALLLLDGIPDFYYRYGYTDMFDATAVEIDRLAILAQAPTDYHVRPITLDDAPALLELYQRQYGPYTGSFERSLELQIHRMQHRQLPVMMAVSPEGKSEGYLLYGQNNEARLGREVAADNWQALLALLRYHALLFDGDSAPATLQYFLPLEAPLTHWLIDTLHVPNISSQDWAARSLIYHHHFADWMGCLINFPLLLDSLVPELQARWLRSLAHWNGEIALTVEEQTRVLRLNGNSVHVTENSASRPFQLELSPQALVQLVFGYRQVQELTTVSHLPHEARSALAILFPSGHTWIARTDWF